MKILVVDDEELLVKGIRFNLQNDGYEIITGSNGAEAVAAAKENAPDLIILDVMMPEMDGMTACAKIREFSNVPIILLTAKTDDMDKLMGFEHGADDYVTKPFNILELKARVRALLRRSCAQAEESTPTLCIGSVSLDLNARNAYRDGVLADLTAKEFDLLEFFYENRGIVFSRDDLLEKVWGYDYQGDTRTVDVHIRRLRDKLNEDKDNSIVETVFGVGYVVR